MQEVEKEGNIGLFKAHTVIEGMTSVHPDTVLVLVRERGVRGSARFTASPSDSPSLTRQEKEKKERTGGAGKAVPAPPVRSWSTHFHGQSEGASRRASQ